MYSSRMIGRIGGRLSKVVPYVSSSSFSIISTRNFLASFGSKPTSPTFVCSNLLSSNHQFQFQHRPFSSFVTNEATKELEQELRGYIRQNDRAKITEKITQINLSQAPAHIRTILLAWFTKNDIDTAERIFETTNKRNFKDLELMLEMYCIIGDLTKSLHFFDLILSLGPNHSTISNAQSSLTLLYAFQNNTEKVKEFISLSKTYGSDQSLRFALRALGGYFGCETHLQSSEPSTAIWNWMSEVGIQPDKTCCLFILRAFSEEGKLDEAVKVFEEMKRREMEVSNPITEVMTVVFARLGDLQSVETMEKEAVKRGHQIGHSRITSQALIETYLELNSPEQALGVLDSLEQSGKLDIVGFTPLLQYYMNLKDHKNIQSLLKRMKESEVVLDLLGWNMLLSYYSDNKDVVRMEQAYNDLLLAGFEPDSVTYNTLLKAYCKVNGLAEVESLLSEMERRGSKLNTAGYSTLLNMYCEQGDLQMMKTIFARIISEGRVIPDINIYNVLLKGYASKGHEEEVSSVLSAMKREGIPFTSYTYSCLLQMHIRRKNMGALRTTIDELLREGINLDGRASEKAIKECVDQQPELVEDLLQLFREKGIRLESAGRTPLFPHWLKNGDFRRMEEEFQAIKEEGFTPSTFIHNTMINCFTKTHNWEAASKLLKEKPSFVPLDIWSYNQILNLWVEAKRPLSEITNLLEEMKRDGISPDAATNGVIVKFFLGWPKRTVGQLYEVLGSSPVFDNYGYRALFCYLVKKQEWDRIVLEEKRMKDIGFVPNGFVYSYLFKAYKLQGNRDKLEELLRESLAQGVRLNNDGVYYDLLNCFRDEYRNKTTRYQVLKKLLLDNGVRIEIETPPAALSFEWKKEPNKKKEPKELNKKKEEGEVGMEEVEKEEMEEGDDFLSLFSGGRRGARKQNKRP